MLDLKLLQIFQVVHAERGVSRAAERLGLSQPAVSHALRKLRIEFKDPLFVRTPGGVTPTAKASRLALSVGEALQSLERTVQEASDFDPCASDRLFRIYMTDIGELTFLPGIMEALQARAPGLRISVDQMPLEQIQAGLESGALDLAMGYLPSLSEIIHRPLVDERYVVVTRADHPLVGRSDAADVLYRLEYALVRSHSETRRQLEQLRLGDKVKLTLPHFMVLPAILERCDLATLVPYRLAVHFQTMGAFRIIDGLFESARLEVGLHWCWRMEHDPGHRWLRELIIELYDETSS